MLVRCKKYSVNYPTGIQNAGDIFELTKSQAIHFSQVGWVEILPNHLQPKNPRGQLIISADKPAFDLSKNKQIFRGERKKPISKDEFIKIVKEEIKGVINVTKGVE